MHELSVMMEVVKTVEEEAGKNNVTIIKTLTLQVGEISSVVPEYIKDCYKAAFKDTMLEDAVLEIEIIPAEAKCAECGKC
nr:hydrogenase maturation nickel metallochaperone HypA [Bacillota bacterium]